MKNTGFLNFVRNFAGLNERQYEEELTDTEKMICLNEYKKEKNWKDRIFDRIIEELRPSDKK